MTTRDEVRLHEVPCPLCGGRQVSPVMRDEGYHRITGPALVACTSLDHGAFGQIVACDHCGVRFRSPREDDAAILALYTDVEDHVYLENEAARVATFSRALERLQAHVPVRGPLLDVGCYTGVFLDVAARAGWQVAGLEPSRWAADVATGKGHRVHTGTLDTAPFARGSFAVATMWDALEHYADPVGELKRAREFVRDGGYLALTTMNIDTLAVRLLRKRWPWYMRMHLTYFTPRTVEEALRRAGWRLAHRHRYGHVVTWDYLMLKLAPYWRGGSAVGRAALRRVGLSNRTVTVDLGDFMTVYAEKLPG